MDGGPAPTATKRANHPSFEPRKTRDFIAFQEFVRASFIHANGDLVDEIFRGYESERARLGRPNTDATARELLDRQPQYQIKAWATRYLRQMKYSLAGLGIASLVDSQANDLSRELDTICADAGDALDLDPTLQAPDYFKWVDFHQQPGGVAGDALAGLKYDIGRRTTNPVLANADRPYSLLFEYLPKDREFQRVLDWGTGHGGGAFRWLMEHPGSDVHGIDISAPCLRLAYARSRELGLNVRFSQQDIARLKYADATFDLALHLYMLHEIPRSVTPQVLKEVHRVLKPGGIFLGMDLALVDDAPAQHYVIQAEAWLNNEPFMWDCATGDYVAMGKAAGFSKVSAMPFDKQLRLIPTGGDEGLPRRITWNVYMMEK